MTSSLLPLTRAQIKVEEDPQWMSDEILCTLTIFFLTPTVYGPCIFTQSLKARIT